MASVLCLERFIITVWDVYLQVSVCHGIYVEANYTCGLCTILCVGCGGLTFFFLPHVVSIICVCAEPSIRCLVLFFFF